MKAQWQMMMIFSILLMIGGFTMAMVGVIVEKDLFAYTGLVMMGWTCVTWWFWVMFNIKDMFGRIDKAGNSINEVKDELGIIKKILNSLLGKKDK